MPQITFTFAPDQIRFPACVGVDRLMTQALVHLGLPVAAPVSGTAVLDTGASASSVSSDLVRRLGLPAIGKADVETANGFVEVDTYRVSVGIPNPSGPPGSMLVVDESVIVSEFAHPITGVDILFGLDILLNCRLLIDGPGQVFTLDF